MVRPSQNKGLINKNQQKHTVCYSDDVGIAPSSDDERWDELGRIWRRWILRGRRDTFSTSGSICVAGVVLSVPS